MQILHRNKSDSAVDPAHRWAIASAAMATSIGIVGSGVSGLHLGLYLLAHDVPVTMYADKEPDAIRAGKLLNTVGHHHHTLERERALGVHHWDAAEYGYVCHHHCVLGDPPLRFRGDFDHPSSVIDYRIYLPRLMEDFADRGGRTVLVERFGMDEVERLSHDHDLVVVAVGRRSIGELFPPRPDKSPYDRPQRRLSAGIYAGIAYSEPKGVGVHFSPGHGELLELPIYSHAGFATALLFEAVPGGDLDALVDIRYDDDPAAYNRVVLEKVNAHFPMAAERIDASAFGLWSGRDLLQGALTPIVRHDYARLSSGRYALAVGDSHTVVDPMMGQGANSASYSAWVIGEEIVADVAYDERFCQRVARRREGFVHSVSDWTNLMLNPPQHVLEFIGAMSQDKALCDEFTSNFNDPERQVDVLCTAERTRAYLATRAAAHEAAV
jgi:2-polyprenyl-6-methoxyphenol hydroxylase-like FAD-dependent oxidoreductase